MSTRILIFCLKTWGELGNFVSAQRLRDVIFSCCPTADVTVLSGEEFLPSLQKFGLSLGAIARTSWSDSTKRESYLAMIEQIAQCFPFGAEVDGRHTQVSHIERLIDCIRENRPDLVIGAKGVMTRYCIAALRHMALDVPVVNHVSNHGLLSLTIHHVVGAKRWFVPMESALEAIPSRIDLSSGDVNVIGPISSRDYATWMKTEHGRGGAQGKATVVILCNRGMAEAYLAALEVVLTHPSHPRCVFIAPGQQELVRRVRERMSREPLSWCIALDGLEQLAFHRELFKAAQAWGSFMITKTGPNTMVESVLLGVPMVMHRSWLPMEDWVGPYAQKAGVAQFVDSVDALGRAALDWLEAPEKVELAKQACARVAMELKSRDPAREIRRVLRELLPKRLVN